MFDADPGGLSMRPQGDVPVHLGNLNRALSLQEAEEPLEPKEQNPVPPSCAMGEDGIRDSNLAPHHDHPADDTKQHRGEQDPFALPRNGGCPMDEQVLNTDGLMLQLVVHPQTSSTSPSPQTLDTQESEHDWAGSGLLLQHHHHHQHLHHHQDKGRQQRPFERLPPPPPPPHSPSASPQSHTAHTAHTAPPTSRRDQLQQPQVGWQAASASLPTPGSPQASSPPPRRHRDLHFEQNTDPLVYHSLISSDPVNHNTRTGALSEHSHSPTPTLPAHTQPNANHFNLSSPSPTRSQHPQSASASSPRSLPPNCHDRRRPPTQHAQPYASGAIEPSEAFASQHPHPHPVDHNPPAHQRARFDRHFLPLTPDSPASPGPRWDSLHPNSDPNPLAHQANTAPATTSDASVIPGSTFPPSPLRSPKSPTFSTGPSHSHPFIPEDDTLDLPCLPPDHPRYDHAAPVTTFGQVGRMYRPDSRQSGDTAYSADNYNFSRPRRPSLGSLHRPDFSANMSLRPGTAMSAASDSLGLESRTIPASHNHAPYLPYNPTPRRHPSVGSTMSSSTWASATPSLQHKASQDRMAAYRNVSQNPATANFMGLPHTVLPQGAPPRYYNRGGPLVQSQQSHLYEHEMRSSVRSHLTTSTAQETLFTEPERSSVMTKTSSMFSSSFRNTRQSSFFGPHNPSLEVRDSLSVDDVMGMYENGFNDSDMDLARRMSGFELDRERPEIPTLRLARGGIGDHDSSRPGSAVSHNSEAASRLLEAMSQTNPMPIPGRSFPLNGDGPVVLRDTNAFFRKSLASSLPKDMRLSFISTRSRMEDDDAADEGDTNGPSETDSARHSRHDSGKMVGPQSEENCPVEDPAKHKDSIPTTDALPLPSKDSLSPQPAAVTERPSAPPATSQQVQHVQGAAQPEDLDPEANDRYGFRKSNQYITRDQYDEWNGQYSEYLARRRKKWDIFLKDNGLMTDQPNRFPQHSAKAKRFVRKGIPPEWRGAAWFYYAGGPKILANNRGVYDQMVKRAANGDLKDVCREDIERDLYRTFPDNTRFRRKAPPAAPGQGPSPDPTPAHSRNNSTQSANPPPRAPGSEPEIIDQLRRVLQAFAIFNPSIGYCQSLNFLGGMLLLFVESEEQAFWLLNIITRVYLPGTHEMSLEGSKVDLSVLMAELQEVLPNVYTKISDDGSSTGKKKSRRHRHNKGAPAASDNLPPVTLALTAWFMSCFIGTLPIETTLRVWDVFFYEGSKTLFRVALAIFKAGENEIRAISDPMEVFAVVQSMPRKMLDANTLMEICFKRRSGLNHITSEAIDERRAERKERLQIERKEAVAAAQGNPGIQSAATIAVDRSRKQADLLSVNSGDGMRRKHTLFGRRPQKDRGLVGV